MRTAFKGKILFVFSDPGGAKPCLAIIETIRNANITAVSDRSYAFYKDFNIVVEMLNMAPAKFIDKLKPDLIFTGTSYKSDIERQFIEQSLKKNIPCWSFVDHWTNISERFMGSKGKLILPSQIWVVDERAKEIAIKEGIEEHRLRVSGNPFHTWLRQWKPSISKGEYLKKAGINNVHKKFIVFAPDPLSNINGKEVYGFDEISALSEMQLMINENFEEHPDWLFLIKLHPNQNIERIRSVIGKNDLFMILPKDVDGNETMFFSDLIIGFFSSFLLEARIMNKQVIRFIDPQIGNDPFAPMNVGSIANKDNLITEISKRI